MEQLSIYAPARLKSVAAHPITSLLPEFATSERFAQIRTRETVRYNCIVLVARSLLDKPLLVQHTHDGWGRNAWIQLLQLPVTYRFVFRHSSLLVRGCIKAFYSHVHLVQLNAVAKRVFFPSTTCGNSPLNPSLL